ncbi:MAG: sulfite exporter TauE/SafE family protein [Dethiobacteria bacterium]|jgi:uncharacterized membrane protein YfcA|nr:sulfite exporter TauE/SafE family protein [Bacillota bacterium]HQD53087.1 sulfite exporter TauE/SafE family protein [Bacillota bacterium]
MTFIVMLLIGFIAGVMTGLIGASGVMVLVPGIIMLGYSTFDAIGVSLFADTIASLVVSWTYYKAGNLNLAQGWWIVLGSVVGAQIGSFISPHVPEVGLGNSFGIFLVVSAIIFWRRGKNNPLSLNEEAAVKEGSGNSILQLLRKNVIASGILLGLLVGIISGLLGAGGGVMILLILVFVMGYKMHEGVGTSTLIMAFTAASGAIGHALTGNLPAKAALCSAAGTVAGGRIAARYANKVNEAKLSKIVGAIFCMLGLMMLINM